jgi:hypothetical protein
MNEWVDRINAAAKQSEAGPSKVQTLPAGGSAGAGGGGKEKGRKGGFLTLLKK